LRVNSGNAELIIKIEHYGRPKGFWHVIGSYLG